MRLPRYFLNGRHLRAARELAGLSRKAVAIAAGLHPNSVKAWELVCTPPEGVAVNRIRKALEARGVWASVAPVEGGEVAQLTLERLAA